ncbi:hypothetical protein [Nocardia wallacei]|uniref:Uncharacterized protein n=1 Tax=Nocardia wallacei TaxID=480035 RepID=A0A7G1KNK2_9NOCA|nr:hypothetical protein [Nocardia wallacei]BCK56680.1 hypothetical protein NWFMUON74_44520 [Nocardia wallacei]
MTDDHKGRGGTVSGRTAADRDRIIAGLWEDGKGYRAIASTLGVTARQVETVLGHVAVLRGAGHSDAEIGRRVGLPRSSVQRLRGSAAPVSTERKSTAVTALAQMGGMQLDVLGWFLGTDRKRTYLLVRQLRKDKVVRDLEKVVAGDKWVIPTRVTASRHLGFPVREWRPSPDKAAHHRAVAQARIMLVGTDLERWISERVLWHRAGAAAAASRGGRGRTEVPHIHDGRFLGDVDGVHGWWAVEVELSRKSSTAMDVALQGAIRAAARPDEPETMVGLVYLCRSAQVLDGVNAAVERLPAELARLLPRIAIGDFDDEWTQFLADRNAAKAAKRRRRNHIHLTGEAS